MTTFQQVSSPLDQVVEVKGAPGVSLDAKAEPKGYTTTVPFTDRLSEQWLLERTYHAHLLNGGEPSVSAFTEAMKQLIDFDVPISKQSWKSKLPERVPLKKSTNFYVPISTWSEITREEASAAYQQGTPILLYGEHSWERSNADNGTWRPNKNVREVIFGDAQEHAEEVSGTDIAVCYLDATRGSFSNATWKAWFSSDTALILDGSAHGSITFLRPFIQYPFTTHYTVVASEGHVSEYADRAKAIQGFSTFPSQNTSSEDKERTGFPLLCYYHDVTYSSGVYRIEFFGPRMDEQGYKV